VGNVLHMNVTGFRQIDVAGVRVIPVAAPSHPLASTGERSQRGTRDFVQIVLSEQPLGGGRDIGVVSLNTWRVGDLTAKHKLILAGIGWGGMPEPMVRADIKSGSLVQLNLRDWRGGEYFMKAVHKIDTPPGPAGRWLIKRLAASGGGAEAHDLNASQPIKANRYGPAEKRKVARHLR
jgi:DNA-binding transcriptional LysR family regulator